MHRLFLLIALISVASACQTNPGGSPAAPGSAAPAGGQSVDQYVAQFGGDRATYERIFAETDCAALEEIYDLAVIANSAAQPESPEARAAQGIIAAADARQQAAGCYN